MATGTFRGTGRAKMQGSGQLNRLEWFLKSQRSFMTKFGEPLEQILPIVTYLVPVDENDPLGGMWSQVVSSMLDLFTLYRTSLFRNLDDLPVEGGPRNYTVAAFTLKSLRYVQVLLEMHGLSTGGIKRALRMCMLVEFIKLMLRLVLRKRMPYAFYIDDDAVEEVRPVELPTHDDERSKAYVGSRSGKQLPLFSRKKNADDFIIGRSEPSPMLNIAEVLFHIRPFIHLWLLHRRGRQSWAAWWVALIFEGLSVLLLMQAMSRRSHTQACKLEEAELRRRTNALYYSVLRSPFFDKFLKAPCEAIDQRVRQIPILNLFNVTERGLSLQPFYFSTSPS